MAAPTIAQRLRRRFIVMSRDEALISALRAAAPNGWEVIVTTDLDALGPWNELLLYRFLLLDLDEVDAFDPLDVIRAVRMEHMLNLAVLCFGGDQDVRDEMRMLRADRFFDRDEIVRVVPEFFRQYGW